MMEVEEEDFLPDEISSLPGQFRSGPTPPKKLKRSEYNENNEEKECYTFTDDDKESLPDSISSSEYNEDLEEIPSMSSDDISETRDRPIKRYKARNVSGVGGRKYEVLTSAWLLLRLTLKHKNVKNFEFSTENNDYFPFFDDIVVEITSDIKEKYLIQLKYAENNTALTRIEGAFTTKKKATKTNPDPITITKILEKEQDSKAIVLMNRKYNINIKTITEKNPDPDRAFKIEIDKSTLTVGKQKKEEQAKIILFNELYDKEYCYGFVDKDKNNNILENLLLYTNQRDNETIKEEIKIMLQEFVGGEEKLKEEKLEESIRIYTEFIEVWHHRSGVKAVLTKSVMKDVIAWCLLCPYVKYWDLPKQVPVKSEKFREAILKFTITHLDIKKFDKIKSIGPDIKSESLDVQDKLLEYEIMFPKQESLKEDVKKKHTKILWLMNKCPLAVEDNNTTRKTIQELCPDKYFVLLYENKGENFKCLENSFENLSHLKRKHRRIYNYVMKEFYCKMQNRSEISLGTLIQENEEIPKIISPNELVDMLDGPLMIGENDIEEEKIECYIKRSLTNNEVKYDFLDTIKNRDIIIISCVRNFAEISYRFPYLSMLELKKFLSDEDHQEEVDVLLTKEECSEDEFNRTCVKCSNKTCHHLRMIENTNDLEWVRSNQNADKPKEFLIKDRFSKVEHLTNSKINLICDHPGTGKSTIFKQIKNRSLPSMWVVLVDASKYSKHYESAGDDINEFKKCILRNISEKVTTYKQFITKLLEIFQAKGRIFYCWDGLDELSEANLSVVKNIISNLANEPECQLWLTSRNHLRQDLENEFNVIARTIKPFDEDDQKKYLMERLGKEEEYIDKIYDKIKTSLDLHSPNEVLGIPLHIYLLVELLNKDKDKYDDLLEGMFSVADLYKHFVDGKFDDYFGRKLKILNIENRDVLEVYRVATIDRWQKVSLKLHFNSRFLDKWNVVIESGRDHEGFGVRTDGDDLPKFHSSFGEYFTALYLSQNSEKVSDIVNFIFEEKYDNIRFFLDLIWSKNSPPHKAVIYKNYQFLEKYDENAILRNRNENRQSTLQLACSWSTKYKNLDETELPDNEYIVQVPPEFRSWKKEDDAYTKTLYFLSDKFCVEEISELLINKIERLFYCQQSLSLLPLVRLVSKSNTNLEKFGKHVATIFYYCVIFDIEEVLNICKCKYYVKNQWGKSMFYEAVLSKSFKIMEKFVKDKEYTRMLQENTENLVWKAFKIEDYKMAQLLLDADVIPRAPDDRYSQMLIVRFYKEKRLRIVDLDSLVKHGQDPNVKDCEGKRLIHYACENRDSDMVRLLMKHDALVHVKGKHRLYPIHYACKKEDDNIVKMLLHKETSRKTNKVNVNVADRNRQMPIHYGCISKNDIIVRLLLLTDKQANLNYKDIHKKMPIHYACDGLGNETIVNLLMQNGTKINVKDKNKKMPIHYACVSGNKEIINLLVQKGGMLDTADSFGKLPIHYSCENGHYEISEILINEKGVQQLNIEDDFGKMPIHYACEEGHYEVVKLLIRNMAKLDHGDINGEMPLHRAFYRQHYEVVKLLIDRGVPLDMPDKYGETPIHYACKRGLKDVVELLLDKGINKDVVNKCKKTPVYYACEEGYYKIVKMMVQKGADLHVVLEKDGKLPFHRACERGHELIVEFLIPLVNVNATDNLRKTPLHGACKNGHLRIIQLLIKNGAKFDIPDSKGKFPVDQAITYKWYKMNKEKKTKFIELIRRVIDSNLAITYKWHKINKEKKTKFLELIRRVIDSNSVSNDQKIVCEKVLLDELCTNWQDF